MQKWNFMAAALAGALVSSTISSALSLQNNLSAWAEDPEEERLVVARALTVVASQGLPSLNEEFFESFIDFASAQPELQSKKIGEIGSMCVAMHSRAAQDSRWLCLGSRIFGNVRVWLLRRHQRPRSSLPVPAPRM
jgi:hypothetical protein